MTPRKYRLLVAAASEEIFRAIRSQVARDLRASATLQPQRCLPEQVEARLREADTEVLLVIADHCQEDLPAAVRRWRVLRPDLQVLFFFRRLPHTRALVELVRSGAFDVLETEFGATSEALIQDTLHHVLRRLDEIRVGSYERAQARQTVADVGLIGESAEMQNLFVQVMHAARLSCPVLVSGEPGSGKRLLAHAIHALSERSSKPLATVDCGSLSPPLLGIALCGQAGPPRVPPGIGDSRGQLFAFASGGSLLLNEIAEIPYPVQVHLLRILEQAEAGGPAPENVRLLSTTSRRMDQLVEVKAFRADLCYRLNVLPIEVPPLRRRVQDVPLLGRYFLSRHQRDNRVFELAAETVGALCRYPWPGNVRELKAAIDHAVAHSVDDTILESHLPEPVFSGKPAVREEDSFSSSELNLERLERQAILRALQISGFDKTKTARLLGIGKTTMYRKLKEMSGKPRPAGRRGRP